MYNLTGNIEDIDESIRFGRLTLEQEAANDRVSQRVPDHISNLAASLSYRFEKTNSQDNLQQAINLQNAALGMLSQAPNAERAMTLGNLSSFLETHYETSKYMDDLEEVIRCARSAVDGSLTGSPDEGDHLERLPRLLARRFKHMSDSKELEEAEIQAENAVIAPVYEGGDDKGRLVVPAFSRILVVSDFSLERTLTVDYVNRAYPMAQHANSQFPDGDSRTLLNNLAGVLQHRFKRSNSQHDFDIAITSTQEGLASIGPNASQQFQLLCELEIQKIPGFVPN